MDYAALKTLITGQTGTPQDIADWANTPSMLVVGMVPRSIFSMWCGSTGLRGAIEDIAVTTGHPLRAIALTVLDFLRGGVADALDFADARNQMMLGAWVQAGALTQAQADELIALATTLKSPAENAGLGVVHVGDVQNALEAV